MNFEESYNDNEIEVIEPEKVEQENPNEEEVKEALKDLEEEAKKIAEERKN
jgi:hypothetical protein